MILFFNTFLALRSHSPSQDPVFISKAEKWLGGEYPKWDGYVYYNDDMYRLYLLQDEDTRAVRIAAMTESGKHENMTIWTAFCMCFVSTLIFVHRLRLSVHDQMTGRHEWYRQESATIVLQRLPVYHFSTIFQPRNYGEFPIHFLNAIGSYLSIFCWLTGTTYSLVLFIDATKFIEEVVDLSRGY